MKYKVGDKVRVISGLVVDGAYGNWEFTEKMKKYKGKSVTISEVCQDYYRIKEDEEYGYYTDEMFEPVEEIEEMSAEELVKIIGNICEVHNECEKCPLLEVRGEEYCMIGMGKNADKTLKIAKQWKADHEKKPIETEFIYIVRIIEDKKCVHEEEMVGESEDEAQERVLKKYCEDHEGKFYAVAERICRVKE